jgi:predicted acetyltransferase
MNPDSTLHVRPTSTADRELLERLWLLFRHDMSAVDGALPDAQGRFRTERLTSALSDPTWSGFLATWDHSPVGFALVRGLDGPVRVLNSFFVVAAARRHGIGRSLARHVLRALPGHWEIAFQDSNLPAAAFWPLVADDVAPGAWSVEQRAVPGRPDLAADSWLALVAR